MAFCIMRMEKIRSSGSLRRAAMHNTRERPPLNADPLRREENWVQGGSVDEVMKTYQERLPEKVRKNAVHAVELVMTASADFQGNWREYLKDCDKWAEGLFGKENVLSVAHHLDEKTPHAQILVMPLKDGKLNAKHFIGGSRDRMAELQDDFYRQVGWPAGLSRGEPRAETKARHTPHTLAATAAKLEEKEKELEKRESAVALTEAKVREIRERGLELIKASPERIQTLLQNPDALRKFADEREQKILEHEKQIRQRR
jgi:hypothetical protein